MALHRVQNKFILGGNHGMWWIFKTMVDAGWTVPMSGSGNSGLYATSNVFDMSQLPQQYNLLGANGVGIGQEAWGHGLCWVVLEDPSGNRQHIFKRHTLISSAGYDSRWYMGYSPGGRFGEGQTPGVDWNENTIPSAPDQINYNGTPSNEGSIFLGGGSLSLIFMLADDTPAPSGEYGVLCLEIHGSNDLSGCFMIDDVRNHVPGYGHPLTIGYAYNRSNVFNTGSINENWHMYTLRDPGGPSEAWVTINYAWCRWAGASSLNQQIPVRGGVGVDGKQRAVAALVGYENNVGHLGLSRWLNWASWPANYPTTANGRKDLFVDHVVIKDVLDGTEAPKTI